MATLSKNGAEIARFDRLKKSYSVRSNGKILKNTGFGWKLCKLKDGVTTDDFIRNQKAMEEKLRSERPCYIAYREAVKSEFPLSVRWKYLAAESLLGDDIDGIWSELNDGFDPIHVDIDTLADLNRRRSAANLEASAIKS